ncbi:MAG: ATP-dependent nuclease [Parvibaculales bacterium]
MEIRSLRIKNYKGINDQTIRFDRCSNANIISLIGLNESGKTTTLEAIERFAMGEAPEENPVVPLGFGFNNAEEPTSFIPNNKISSFTNSIDLIADIKISEQEIEQFINVFNEFINDEDNRQKYDCSLWRIKAEEFRKPIKITRSFHFEKSEFQKAELSQPLIRITSTANGVISELPEELQKLFESELLSLLPSINFFPAALSEFPEKIYLEETESEATNEKHEKVIKCYREIIGDILAVDEMNIDEHIIDRITSEDDSAQRSLQGVINGIRSRIENSVVKEWQNIFGSKNNVERSVQVVSGKDERGYFLEIKLRQGEEEFSIKDTSLGHRWFFCFLMFTAFRKNRIETNKPVIFLLDEPAASLHPSAQSKMLETFKNITDDCCQVIYTTHSPYLIEPNWLESTFIVQNEAVRSDDDVWSPTVDVKITPYRTMLASEDENQALYSKIIFDALDYSLPKIDVLNSMPKIVVEGKGDYYIYEYFKKLSPKLNQNFQFVPGAGASKLEPIISILISWGQKYCVLLDGDVAGKGNAKKIRKNFLLSKKTVLELDAIDQEFTDLESLLSDELKERISSNKRKKEIRQFFQEKLACDEEIEVDEMTKGNFNRVFEFLSNNLSEQT